MCFASQQNEPPMSEKGQQKAKYQLRANVFRYAPYERTSTGTNVVSENCHFPFWVIRTRISLL
jgi:hypothetical protein